MLCSREGISITCLLRGLEGEGVWSLQVYIQFSDPHSVHVSPDYYSFFLSYYWLSSECYGSTLLEH